MIEATIWFWGDGQARFGNKYSDLENAENNYLSSSGKTIKNMTLTFLKLEEKCKFFQNFRLASLATVKFSNNSFGSLCSHSILKQWYILILLWIPTHTMYQWVYTINCTSQFGYWQPTLFLWHNIQAHNGTILYENYPKKILGGAPQSPLQ